MRTIEERVAWLEGHVSEQSHALVEIGDGLHRFENRMDSRFAGTDARFDSIDRRFDAIDRRFEALELRFDGVDRRFEALELRFDAVDRRFEAIDRQFETMTRRFDSVDRHIHALDDRLSRQLEGVDQKASRHFLWLVGIQVTTLATIVGAVVSALAGS